MASTTVDTNPTSMRPAWLGEGTFPFTSRFASVGGQRLHYLDEGSGPALLLVSAGMWSFMFRDIILRLRDDFRCLTLDFPGSGLTEPDADHNQSVASNARVLEGFMRMMNLDDVTMVVHDAGGPIGMSVATAHPDWFRAFVISNTFAWPLADYPMVRWMVRFMRTPLFGAMNTNLNLMARFSATGSAVGRHFDAADRDAFKGPWRSRHARRATQGVLAGLGGIDHELADLERAIGERLRDHPVLTVFGRKNDPYGWQERWGGLFSSARAVGIEDGSHFPFADDPDRYAGAIRDWWADVVVRPASATRDVA